MHAHGDFVENETLTLSIPKKLKKEMREIRGMNWSAETRNFLEERVKRLKVLKKLDQITKNSTLTEEDAVKIGRKINKEVSRRFISTIKS